MKLRHLTPPGYLVWFWAQITVCVEIHMLSLCLSGFFIPPPKNIALDLVADFKGYVTPRNDIFPSYVGARISSVDSRALAVDLRGGGWH